MNAPANYLSHEVLSDIAEFIERYLQEFKDEIKAYKIDGLETLRNKSNAVGLLKLC